MEHGRVGHWSASLNRYLPSPHHRTPRVKAVLIRTCHIDLRASADAMKVITDLQSGSRPRAILKIRPPSRLDYMACHRPQIPTTYILFVLFLFVWALDLVIQ